MNNINNVSVLSKWLFNAYISIHFAIWTGPVSRWQGGGFKDLFYVHLYFGKWYNLTTVLCKICSNWLNIPTRWSKKSYIDLHFVSWTKMITCQLRKEWFDRSIPWRRLVDVETWSRCLKAWQIWGKSLWRIILYRSTQKMAHHLPTSWEEIFRKKELLRLWCLNWLWGPLNLCIICDIFNRFQFKIDWMSLVHPDIQEWTVWFTPYTIAEIDQLQRICF